MENYIFKNVSFTYPLMEEKALNDISFSINSNEFVLICGPSGCGKSTLLRHMKTCISPHGNLQGEIIYKNSLLKEVNQRIQSSEIGFVMQSPDNQIVTDKVWHELAFGLESLGCDTNTIRRRISEVVAFFGIESWFYKDVSELSGGQKQLLVLASVLAMNPKVIILDEPTSQLDPIASSEFLSMLWKINSELGITIVLTEHRLEEVFSYANKVIVMNQGKIVANSTPLEVGLLLKEKENKMFLAMPSAMKVWANIDTKLDCPITIKEGSKFLTDRNEKEEKLLALPIKKENKLNDEVVIDINDIWFRYDKNSDDIVKGLKLKIHKGEIYSILGGNGVGKTTTLKIISRLVEAYRGDIKTIGKIGFLPQNPQALFIKRTVREDLYDIIKYQKLTKEQEDNEVKRIVKLCNLSSFIDRHPFDISGGEQQRTALAKVLLTYPDIILLDEPTKSLDAEFKMEFAHILKKLTNQGITIVMVTHDIEFCAQYSNRCGMFFDGHIVSEDSARNFFTGNNFYTTHANRMARHLIPDAVTVNDIIYCCDGRVEKEIIEEEVNIEDLPCIKPTSINYKPKTLPLYRKVLAFISLILSIGVFLYATSITDLSSIINSNGISELGKEQLILYIILFVSLSLFLISIGRKNNKIKNIQTEKQKRNLSKRTIVATISIILLIPLTIFLGVYYFNDKHYNIIAILVLLESIAPFLIIFEGRKPKARELVIIAVICAISIAGRSLFFMLPQFKPVLALTIIAGVAFGGEVGFLVGAVTMLASNIFFTQGPWTPWQMFAMGIIGFLAGILFKKGALRGTRVSLSIFGAFSAVIIYGGIMNPASAIIMATEKLSIETLVSFYITGLPMDLIHAFATVIFLMFIAEPMLEKLERIKEKYGLIE